MPNGNRSPQLFFRIFSRLDVSGECWLWQGALRGGNQERHKGGRAKYGEISVENKTQYVHRLMYELTKGYIPEGWHVDHSCLTAHCANPDHLEAVPGVENSRRAAALTNKCPDYIAEEW